MSSVRYKRTKDVQEDEMPLPMNGENEGVIEMETMAPDEVVDAEYIEETPQPHTQPQQVRGKKPCNYTHGFLIWAIVSTGLFIIMICIAVIVHETPRNIKWCCINHEEQLKCHNMSLYFMVEGLDPVLECVKASSVEECVGLVDTDEADALTIPNSYLFQYRNQLRPILGEEYHPGEFGSYLVAVTRKSDQLTLNTLSRSLACVGDIDLTVGALANHSVITLSPQTCDGAAALAKLFDGAYRVQGKCVNNYCGFDEAIECLVEATMRAVAFSDHITALDKLQIKYGANPDGYELLCPGGGSKNLSDYKTCNLGWIPSNAVVVSSKMRAGSDINVPMDIVEVMHVAQLYYGKHSTKFNMFSSHGKPNLIFQDRTMKLVPLVRNCTPQAYLGETLLSIQYARLCQFAPSRRLHSCLLPQYAQKP